MRDLRPACLVDLGDRINSVAAAQDGVRERYVRRRLEDAAVPVYHVLGNTDVERLAKHDALSAVKKGWAAEVVDLGAVRLVLLDTVDPAAERTGGTIGAAQIEWLRSALTVPADPLEATDRDDGAAPGPACLVFGHHPLDEPVLEGHRYFANRPRLAGVVNRAEVRAVLEEARAVAAVFSGHLHRTSAAEINGVPYVTIGSLVDTAYTNDEPAGTYALVTVGSEDVAVGVFGRAPAEFRFSRSTALR